jgi:hypothetical protein
MVTVAFFVRLDAKPGKRRRDELPLGVFPWSWKSRQPSPGLAFASGQARSESLMPPPNEAGYAMQFRGSVTDVPGVACSLSTRFVPSPA